MGFQLEYLVAEDDLLPAVVKVVILQREVVYLHGVEFCLDNDGSGNDVVRRDLRVLVVFQDPLVEYPFLSEGIFGQGPDGFAVIPEMDGNGLHLVRVVLVHHDEPDFVHALEAGSEREVGADGLAAFILRFAVEPAQELLALYHRVFRQLQQVAVVVFVGLIQTALDDVLDREDVLSILRPDGHVGGDRYGVVKGRRVPVPGVVYPLGAVAVLVRYAGDVVQGVVAVPVHGLFCNKGGRVMCFRVAVEADRVLNRVVIRHEVQIAADDVIIGEPLDGAPFGPLAAGMGLADSPEGFVVFALLKGDLVESVSFKGLAESDGGFLWHVPGPDNVAVPVAEGEGPAVLRHQGAVRFAVQSQHRCGQQAQHHYQRQQQGKNALVAPGVHRMVASFCFSPDAGSRTPLSGHLIIGFYINAHGYTINKQLQLMVTYLCENINSVLLKSA